MVPDNTTILEGTPDSITSAYATVTYSGGKVRSSGISGSDCKIDGVTYSLWVKDSKGSYYYEGDEGDMVSYADAEKLPAVRILFSLQIKWIVSRTSRPRYTIRTLQRCRLLLNIL